MKNWLKYGLIPTLLLTAFSAVTASAKNIATAVLDKAADSNHVSVALDFSETKTEIITSLRFKLLVVVEEGELAKEDVSFTFADIPGEVKDAQISYDEDVTDYIVDIVVSGKENIFRDAVGKPLTIGTLELPDGEYSAEVGLVAYDDGSGAESTDTPSGASADVIEADEEKDLSNTMSMLEYVENAGMESMKVQMKADRQILVGKDSEPVQSEPPQSEPPQSEPVQSEPPQSEPAQTDPAQTDPAQSGSSQTEAAQTGSETLPDGAGTTISFSKKAKTVLTVTPVTGTKKLKFSWEKISGADGYQILQYNSKLKKYKKIATVSKKRTSYTAKFEFGKTCKFKIRAYKKRGKGKYNYSRFSDVVKVKVSAFDKTKKTTLKASGKKDNSKITLRWTKVRGADGYKLYQYDSEAGKYELLATVKGRKKTSYAASGDYKPGKTYKFRIRAFARDPKGKEILGAATVVRYKTYRQKTKTGAESEESIQTPLSEHTSATE